VSVEELLEAMPPPASPIHVGKRDGWPKLVRKLGLALPTDWRDFALAYGSGYFGDRITVLNPLGPGFGKVFGKYCTSVDLIKDVIGMPYEVYPRNPGLLIWGSDDNGNKLFWLTEGESDQWPLVLRTPEGEYETRQMPMTTFLSRVLSNDLRCILWPRRFSSKHRTFTPRAE
jgi:hypothetical protein